MRRMCRNVAESGYPQGSRAAKFPSNDRRLHANGAQYPGNVRMCGDSFHRHQVSYVNNAPVRNVEVNALK